MGSDPKDDGRKVPSARDDEPSDAELLDSIRIPRHPLGALSAPRR